MIELVINERVLTRCLCSYDFQNLSAHAALLYFSTAEGTHGWRLATVWMVVYFRVTRLLFLAIKREKFFLLAPAYHPQIHTHTIVQDIAIVGRGLRVRLSFLQGFLLVCLFHSIHSLPPSCLAEAKLWALSVLSSRAELAQVLARGCCF